MSEPAHEAGAITPATAPPRELFVRHARRDGRSVAILRAVDHGDSCMVEAEVYPVGARNAEPSRPGPYTLKAVEKTPGVYELTWAKDGRATFKVGRSVRPGHTHIRWRRIDTHEILDRP